MTCCHSGATGHTVQFYDDDAFLVRAVADHLTATFKTGGTGIVVARSAIIDGVMDNLRGEGLDPDHAVKAGTLVTLDASATLDLFMRGGTPDARLFDDSVGNVVRGAIARGGDVRVFGEMVAVLWAQGNHEGAVRLEQFWNDLAERHPFFLLCGYAMSSFPSSTYTQLFSQVCNLHTAVVPTEGYTLESGAEERHRTVARLQQRAVSLENEAGQRRRAESALRESERRLRVAMGAGRMGTWELDARSGGMHWSPSLVAIHGLERDAFGGTLESFERCVHPEDRAQVSAAITDALRSGKDCYLLYRVTLPDRSVRWIEGHAAIDTDEGGSRLTGVSSDVTARKLAEDAAARLAAIVESSNDAIASKTLGGTITSWNRAAERILGYTAEEIVGKSVMMLIPPDRHHEEGMILGKVSSGERVESFETQRLAKGGRLLDVAVTVSPIRDASGTIIGASKILRDVTARKQIEREKAALNDRLHDVLQDLQASNERLEAAVAERTHQLEQSHTRMRLTERMASLGTLSAGIGHDMGNLLLPIHVRIQSLEERGAPAEDVAAIKCCVEYLQRLAKGLRLLALDPDLAGDDEPIELHAWWSEVGAMMLTSVPRGVILESRLALGLPRVRMPRHQLTQMVFNLVQNAGHATRERADGRIIVEAAPGPGQQVVLRVRDNGVGMTPDVKARCLEPFFTTRTRSLSTGLGLSLVVTAVERAGGKLEIDSAPNAGTTFSASLPSAPPAAAAVPTRGTATVRIASPRFRGLVTSILRGMGVESGAGDDAAARLLVVDDPAALDGFLDQHAARRAVVLGGSPAPRIQATAIDPKVTELRDALATAIDACYAE